MAYGTGTINSATPVRDLAAAVAAQLTAGGYTFVETYATPAGATWNQVIYGGGQFIAAVNGVATVITSPDGQTWTQRPLPLSQAWSTVAYGAGLYVLMATGNATYLTSPDGITWTQRTMPVAGAWNRNLIFAGGQFVCFNANAAYTSPDGINWTARTMPTTQTWTTATYGGTTYVALGSSTGTWVTSTDGITWTQRTGALSAVNYPSVVYANGLFVTVAQGNPVAFTSPDGITWTSRTLPATAAWQSVAYGAGLFVTVANGGVTYTATSPDGITWTQRNNALPNTGAWFTLAYGAGQFAALATSSNTGASSPDGLTWTQRNMPGTAATTTADVWKSPGAGNSFGSDWYLILRRTADTATALFYQVAETYDPVAHKASNVGGTGASVVPTATTFVNPAGAVSPDQTIGVGSSLTVTSAVVFTYWVSATPDRFILAVKTSTTETGGFYAGLYEDLLPSGVTQFPLVCARFPVDLAAGGQIGAGSGSATGGFTREPGATVATVNNFAAAISNGTAVGASNTGQYQQSWTPMPGAGALYGNPGGLSRVVLGSVRIAQTCDAIRGLLYGCLSSGVVSLAGDTITTGGKTYVRVTGPATNYGFFVDQAL